MRSRSRLRTLITSTLLLLVVPPPGSATAEEAPATVDGLVVEASIEPSVVPSGEAVRLRATFRNTGAEPIEVFLPEHLGSIVFPTWRLVGEDGRAWRPHQASFQSMWTRGLQGEILKLAPGGSRAFDVRVTHVVPDADEAAIADAVALPAGAYTVTAAYEHAEATVPWGEEAFRRRREPHPGLWTGTAVSAPARLQVEPSKDPVLVLEAPEAVEPGRPYDLEITLRNDTARPMTLSGALVVNVASKARGSGNAHFVLRDEDWQPGVPGRVHAVQLPARGTRTWTIDLLAQGFGDADGRSARYRGLVDYLRTGRFRLTARLVDADGRAIATAGLWRRMEEPASLEGRGLVLAVEHLPRPGPGVQVRVRLENTGTEPVAVPTRLAFPQTVCFSLVRPGAEERARLAVSRKASSRPGGALPEVGARGVIHEGWSWNGDASEASDPLDLAARALLAPGSTLERTFDLGRLVLPDRTLGHGVWVLRAYWRNLESGERLGMDPPLVTGLLVSDPIEIRGRNW